ncbi:unnamed protein product [Penicillium egyptiacum]|uniref:Xaa-Pro dipeptidyl-peptidase C-terminal domain-containing protein n=1 Tax=Penicillium egyptiacum TaxID=1303716 RepID=A0A9W4P736_9EURO|nr:unnamed protein product [Penicillium egyptiacum]
MMHGRVGIPQSMLSGFENFEALDPADWTARGYAIVNVDARGVFDSDGDIRWWGTGEGKDGYDAIEHIAQLPWCNEKIAMAGNSWLAIAQWFIAAERPPHLACIAPFEGLSDAYRETLCRGGVPYKPFWTFLGRECLFGKHQQEDTLAMVDKYPLMNEYWEDKTAKIENIKCPAYVVASFSNGLHTAGTFRAFQGIPHQDKWLRVHPTNEWHDIYQPHNNNDLQEFLNYFTKGKQNSWDQTPNVRLSILQFNKAPIMNQAFGDWPIPNTEYRRLYLSSGGSLTQNISPNEITLSYQADAPAFQRVTDTEELSFEYTFDDRSYVVGHPKAVLYMSCNDYDDMDVFVQLRKLDKGGNLLQNLNVSLEHLPFGESEVEDVGSMKHLGPTGILRASHRRLDSRLSQPHLPVLTHSDEEKIIPGEVVKLEIALWPTGISFDAGEKLTFKVAGHHMAFAEFIALQGGYETDNKGRHNLHIGSKYPSYIEIPFITI